MHQEAKRYQRDTGAQGFKGDTGAQGPLGSGANGSQGPKGVEGDTVAQGPKGDTGFQGPKGNKGDTGLQDPRGDNNDTGVRSRKGDQGDTEAQGPKGDEGDTGPQGPSGSGDSADLLTVLLFDGTQIMTGTLYMNSKKVVNLWDPSGSTNASNIEYVDTTANNILSGSETFQGDKNINNNGTKNLNTPTSNTDAVNKILSETTYRKKSDDNQFLRLGSGSRWDADGKTIYDLSRAQYDDEAATLRQVKHITDKKIYMDSLLPQTLKAVC